MTPLFPELQPRDWSDDPLHKTLGQLRDIQSKVDEETSTALHNWSVFHWSTRLKLEAADYHVKVLWHINRHLKDESEDAALYRLRHWQFDEFFFQLAGAFDTLLQEINALYKMGLDPEKVDWETFPKRASEPLFRSLKSARFLKRHWAALWLVEVRMFRNASTHRHFIPFAAHGGETVRVSRYYIAWSLFGMEGHQDDDRQLPEVCEDFLGKASNVIFKCWRLMSEEWPVKP